MNPRPRTLVALLLALATAVPAVGADLNARSFLDASASVDFGEGMGVYDPATANYCLALLRNSSGVSPALVYYAHNGIRYWPVSGGASQDIEAAVDDPTGCATLAPGSQVAADSAQADAGASFWSLSLLGPTQVADLGSAVIDVQYCTSPTAVTGTEVGQDLTPVPVKAFTAAYVTCPEGGWLNYNVFPSCAHFGLATSLGAMEGTTPVSLGNGVGCISQFGSPDGDFATQHCVRVPVFDTVSGTLALAEDSDFFVTGKDGALAGWASATPLPPAPMFPNVANLEADAVAPSCFEGPYVEHAGYPHAHVTIHRFPEASGGLKAISGAPGFTCVETGNPSNVIGAGWTAIASPGSVTCTPHSVPALCGSVTAVGYHGATSGTITVTSACSGLATSVTISGQLADQSTTATGTGTFDWTCSVAETPWHPADDWWTGCDVNLH